MVELEHARELLSSMGLETAATLLDAQMERSLHAEHTYAQFLDELMTDLVPNSVEIESDSSGYSLIDYMATKPKPKELSLNEIIPESTETSQGKREDTR